MVGKKSKEDSLSYTTGDVDKPEQVKNNLYSPPDQIETFKAEKGKTLNHT